MPETDEELEIHRKGDFADTKLEEVRRVIGNLERVEFHPGWIPDTLRDMPESYLALAHVDVDIYRSIWDCCGFIHPRLKTGGVMAFDDYGFPTCPGARKAVDEFFAVFRRIDRNIEPLFIVDGLNDRKRRVALVPLCSRFISCLLVFISRSILFAVLLATTFGSVQAQAQANNTKTPKSKSGSDIDISLGMFGQLTPARTPAEITAFRDGTAYDQTVQGTSSSAGVLGTIHQSFRPWLGYNINFGYSRFSEKYSQGMYFPNPSTPTNPISSFIYGSIGENIYELTGASVVQGPRTTRLDTFVQLGGGVLTFLPTQYPSPYWVVFRPAMVFGTGINYRLSKHWGLRAEYRGLFYKSPSFNGFRGANSDVPTVKLYTITNEPTISIVYRFGGKP